MCERMVAIGPSAVKAQAKLVVIFQLDGWTSYTCCMRFLSLGSKAVVVLFFAVCGGLGAPAVEGKSLYSYTDDKGTRIITDDYTKIPATYRAKVTAVEQEADGYAGEMERAGKLAGSAKSFVVPVPGMSFQQSKIITYAGIFGVLCLLAMNFSRSEAIRALALWCLVLTGICAPVLVYIADDGAAAIMKNKAAEIERKQQNRLSQAP